MTEFGRASCVGDQYINPPVRTNGALNKVPNLAFVRDIGSNGNRPATHLLDFGNCIRGSVGTARVVDHHAGAASRQRKRYAPPDTGSPASDKRMPTLQINVHRFRHDLNFSFVAGATISSTSVALGPGSQPIAAMSSNRSNR
jgi:hypothetical protein